LGLQVHYQNNNFRLKQSRLIRNWLAYAIEDLGFRTGNVSFIFTDDSYIREINRTYLEHDYYTDVITFDLSDKKGTLEGEIYISVDTVKENSLTYKNSFGNEVKRVMIHGILHLAGYGDRDDEEREEMRKMEDYYLENFSEK